MLRKQQDKDNDQVIKILAREIQRADKRRLEDMSQA